MNFRYWKPEILSETCNNIYIWYSRLKSLINLEQYQLEEPAGKLSSYNQEQILEDTSDSVEQNNTLRRQVLALMLLTFGRFDRPEDLVKERIVEFFHFLTGGNIQNLRTVLQDPTKHTGKMQSIKRLCEDLHFVRAQLEKLGLSDNVKKAITEIDFLIEELQEIEEENKKNNKR